MNIVKHDASDFDDSDLLLHCKRKCAAQAILLKQWHQEINEVRVMVEKSRDGHGPPKSFSYGLDNPKQHIKAAYDKLKNLRRYLKSHHASKAQIATTIPQELNLLFLDFESTIHKWEQILLVVLSRIQKLKARHLCDQQRGYPTGGGVVYHPKLYYKIDTHLVYFSGCLAEEAMKRIPFIVDQTLYDSAISK